MYIRANRKIKSSLIIMKIDTHVEDALFTTASEEILKKELSILDRFRFTFYSLLSRIDIRVSLQTM
jgi:hypothetical protein